MPINPNWNIFEKIAKELKLSGERFKNFSQGHINILFSIGDIGVNIPLDKVEAGTYTSFGGHKLTLAEFIAGMDALEKILKNDKLFADIYKKVYQQIMIPILKGQLKEKSLQRGGGSSGSKQLFEKLTGITKRPGNELGKLWKEVYTTILTGLRKLPSGAYGGFSFEDLLNKDIDSPRSTFTNVYMMAEFGTGEEADPGPRKYVSKAKTPFKVSDTLAKEFIGKTSWWFTSLESNRIALRILAKLRKIDRLKKARKFKAAKKIKEPETGFVFAFAFGEKDNPKSIKPRHAILDARGLVKKLRKAYIQANEEIAKQINDLLIDEVPFWPRKGIVINSREPLNDFQDIPNKAKQ